MNTDTTVSHYDALKQVGYYFSYTVDGKEEAIKIEHANIADLQINWNSTELFVDGYLIFKDTFRLTEVLPPVTNIYFKIKAYDFTWNNTDDGSSKYEESFIITRIERQLSANKDLTVRIDFLDKLYYYLSNTYVGKGYNSIKSTDVIKDILQEIPITPNRKLNILSSNVEYDNLVIPQNKPFVSFIKAKELSDGFSFIQSRYTLSTISHGIMNKAFPSLYKNGEGLKFVYDDINNEANPFKIKTIKFLSSDNLLFNVALPDCISYEFNQGDMSKPIRKIKDVGGFSESIGDSSTLVKINSTIGFKRIEVSHQDGIDRFYKFKLLETSLIEITVSGMFFYELFYKVGLELKSTIPGMKTQMPYVNGTYHILKIVDKFNGTNFNQIITLGRVGIA